jgi:hypothetical protein
VSIRTRRSRSTLRFRRQSLSFAFDRKPLLIIIRSLLISCALPIMVGAQELPYTFVFSLQSAAETVRKVNGVVCQLKMEHLESR